MKQKLFSLLIGLGLVQLSYGQYNETIRSDRPGQANSPFTVGSKIFQMQNGFDYNNASKENYTNQLNDVNSVLRYGFTERFEVGLGLNYYNGRIDYGKFQESINGLSSFSVSIRSNVFVGEGLKPSIGYQFNLGLPLVSEEFKSEDLAPKITIVTGQSLTSKLGLTTNFGLAWDGNSSASNFFYIVNLGYSLNDKWSLFIENYGNEANNKINTKFDGGFAYLANNDLQLDLYGGYDQSEGGYQDWFVNAGFSWRIYFNKE